MSINNNIVGIVATMINKTILSCALSFFVPAASLVVAVVERFPSAIAVAAGKTWVVVGDGEMENGIVVLVVRGLVFDLVVLI